LAALIHRPPPALSSPPPYSALADGVRLAVRLTPRARRAAIEGLRETPDGSALAVAVTAPPEDGKANAALEALLAKTLHLPKSAVRVSQGSKSRNKIVVIKGESEALMSKLAELSGVNRHG
jgi:uncharacterized protein (TIGR00251 family)